MNADMVDAPSGLETRRGTTQSYRGQHAHRTFAGDAQRVLGGFPSPNQTLSDVWDGQSDYRAVLATNDPE